MPPAWVAGVLEGGDTGQSGPVVAGARSTAVPVGRGGVGNGVPGRLGRAYHKHPVGYLKEQPGWWLLFRCARHGLVSHTGRLLVTVSGVGGGLWVVGWLLVENCTVDASILFCVVKLSRADGGCLGTRSR